MRHVCFASLISACALFAQNSGEPVDARAWMRQGEQAFKEAKYGDAIAAFQRAVDLDPANVNARLNLATSYFVQYIPGAQSPENTSFADKARAQFEEVLKVEPENRSAMQYLASLAYETASGTSDLDEKLRRLDVARSWYERLLSVDAENKEAWYSLGVIDWMKWYPRWMEVRNQAGMRPDSPGPIPDANLRGELKNCCENLVEGGLSNLQRALNIDPQYDDAMAYMNLLIRERASLADSQAQYDADTATADDWVQKSLEAKKAKGGNRDMVQGAQPSAETPCPAQSAPPAQGVQRIRVGGNVQAANLISKVVPQYPPKAKAKGIQGTVRFQVIIGKDGHIQEVNVVSGPPELVDAARDAVRQWVYRRTMLNGQAVEVVTTIDVNFVLAD